MTHRPQIRTDSERRRAERDELHMQLGRGIAAWMRAESELEGTFIIILHPVPKVVARAIFAAARHFEAKLRIVDSALKAAAPTTVLEKWAPLNNRLGRKSKHRHKLAHGHSNIVEKHAKDGAVISTGFALWDGGNTPGSIHFAEDITRMTGSFRELCRDIGTFNEFLCEQLALPQKYHEGE